MTVSDLIAGMLREEGGFQKAFRNILDELDMSLNEFCQLSGISQSTMYKILEDKREPNLRTVRQVVKALKILMEADDAHFIAVIASTTVVENLPKAIEMEDGTTINIREYPVSTVEDAIIAAVRAERDGALGVVCAPIVAPTIEKILSIPVSRVIPTTSVTLAIDRLRDFI